MKKVVFCLFVASAFIGCSTVKTVESRFYESEIVDGLLFITQEACFFVPSVYCGFLAFDNTKERKPRALIIDRLIIDSNILFNPIVADITMMPNKDSSELVVLLERGRYDYVKENELCVIYSKVKLSILSPPIKKLSFTYLFKFNWNKSVYSFLCFDLGSSMYCNVISINGTQMNNIIRSHTLPLGIESDSVNSAIKYNFD